MRRLPATLLSPVVAVLALVGLAACAGGGTVTLPTAVPSVTLPSVSLPSVSLPAVTLPTPTRSEAPAATVTPTLTPVPSETKPAAQTPAETRTVTQTATQTATQSRTETVTQTLTPTSTPTPTPTATETAPETAPAASESTRWPWLLLAVTMVALLGWLLLRRRAARQLLEAWDKQLEDARREASWVEESLVTQVLAMPTTAEALAVWGAARPRLLAIDESLHALVGDAPDEERAAAAVALRERLTRLVEAVGADASGSAESTPDEFRARRAAVDSARRELRAVVGPMGGSEGTAGGTRPA